MWQEVASLRYNLGMCNAWRLKEEDNIAILEFDYPKRPDINLLTEENMEELKNLLLEIQNNPKHEVLLITSAKNEHFIAGVDIEDLATVSNEDEARQKSEKGKEVFKILESLIIPTVAVINGACVGGGLELSLACKYRVASDSEKVKIGLPEVKLGLLPGWGGSVRLPRLIGLLEALPLILTGQIVPAKKALSSSIIDKIISKDELIEKTIQFIKETKIKKKRKKFALWFLEKTSLGRALLFSTAKKNVLKITGGIYPAPLAIIDFLKGTYGKDLNKSFHKESEVFAELAVTDASKNLINLFLNKKK